MATGDHGGALLLSGCCARETAGVVLRGSVKLSFRAQLNVLNNKAVKETGIAGYLSDTEDGVTNKG